MVLIDSHTISKSIDNDEKVDDIFDSISELDHTKHPKLRRDRFLHKYRTEFKDDLIKPLETPKETKLYPDTEKTTEKLTTLKTTTEHTKHHKSPKRRVGSFWRKFRGKDKKSKHDSQQRKRRIPKNKEYASKYPTTRSHQNSVPRNKSRRKNKNQFVLRKPESNFAKRDTSSNMLFSDKGNRRVRPKGQQRGPNKLQIGISPQIDNMLKHNLENYGKAIEKTTEKPAKEAITGGKTVADESNTGKNTEEPNIEKSLSDEPITIGKPYTEEKTTENLSGVLATMTTQLSRLKQLYGFEKFGPPSYAITTTTYERIDETQNNAIVSPPPTTTTTARSTDPDFTGTAQIEELLNDIKLKAIQMVSEQNPLVTDIITNTVTEATFDADPILTHTDMSGSGFYLSTLVSINDFRDLYEKRTVPPIATREFQRKDPAFVTNTEPHNVAARSIKEEAMTIAHNVEDLLQRELKKVYNKVKNKVSSDFSKEIKKAKSTIKEGINKITTKISTMAKTHELTTTKTKASSFHSRNLTTSTTTTLSPPVRPSRGDQKKFKDKEKIDTVKPSPPTPTYDDYMMLTLYEQMLAKTHEDNVRKMLSTFDSRMKKKRQHLRLSKRNPETLTDEKLKEDIQKIYDDGINMPDYDYMDPSASTDNSSEGMDVTVDSTGTMGTDTTGSMGESSEMPSSSEAPSSEMPSSEVPSSESSALKSTTPMLSTVTQSSIQDTSFEGLSNKISYNDFVNGYRHYLKFQKEQNSANFSNLIKYQAHRHHSVDDIGKFILNKIPPLPSKRLAKRFFDDTDIEYQEITTKSDDSWFRKHFYLFIDNGPPKKFHTSQTVEFKSAVTEPDSKLFPSDSVARPGPRDQVFIKIGSDDTTRSIKDTKDMSLDDLSRILDSIKDKQAASPFLRGLPKAQNENSSSTSATNATDDIAKLRLLPQKFIGRLFGAKRRRAPKRIEESTEYCPQIDMFTENPNKRLKRTAAVDLIDNTIIDNTLLDDFINKGLDEPVTTVSKEVLEDASLQNTKKETSKYGYVDIDLVPRQTAVVKLRDNSSKSSNRFKNFFRKFSFKKNKPKKKHAKRYCQYNMYGGRRRVRFNPIKKLKDIFKVKTDEKDDGGPVFRLPNMPDYDMMTSHIETFKPVKYDKPMTIDEMQRQIPNISDIYNIETVMTKRTTKQSSYFLKLDENDRNLLYNYHIPSSSPTKQFTQQILGTVAFKVFPQKQINIVTNATSGKSKSSVSMQATTTIRPTPSTLRTTTKQKIPPSNVMTVNVKTMRPAPVPTTAPNTKTRETTPLMTLDDMSYILNKLQYKLAKTPKKYARHSTPYYKRGTMMMYNRNLPIHRKKPLEELTIKSKLTRIAKFPISKRHFKLKHDDHFNSGNDYLSFHDGTIFKEYIHQLRNRNASPERKKITRINNMRKSNPSASSRYRDSEKCKYTDYFNDLLMWHNDILNLDKVPSPIWKNILKNIQADSETYTTPNMNNLMKELNEINDFLDEGTEINRLIVTHFSSNSTTIDSVSEATKEGIYAVMKDSSPMNSSPVHRHFKTKNKNDFKPGVIRSVAMDDNTIVTGKNILIKGEAKYYQYNKPKIVDSQLKSSEFITKLNRLNVYDRGAYTKNSKLKGKRRHNQSPPAEADEPAILVDTTLMAYDDDVDSVTKGLEVKKLSRNSQKSSRIHPTYRKGPMVHSPFLKTNKAPMQYYTTPLPMKSCEFEKFLKENKMDVESVTSPILELPTIVESSTPFPKTAGTSPKVHPFRTDITRPTFTTPPKTKKITQKLTKLETLKGVSDGLEKSIKLTSKLLMKPHMLPASPTKKDEFLDDFDRYKRYSELSKLAREAGTVRPAKPTQEINYYNFIKKKMKERLKFEKKATETVVRPTTDMYTIDPRNKEVEITIINFDDIDKLTTPQAYDSYSLPILKKDDTPPTFPDFSERQDSTNETTSKPDYSQKEEIHNGLLYKDIFKERTTSTTTEFTSMDYTKSTEYVDPIVNDAPTMSVNKLRYPFDKMPQMYPSILSKMHGKNFNVPKRVHISSHHYKYDIFYDEKKSLKSGREGLPGRPKQSGDSGAAASGQRQPMKLTLIRSPTIFRQGEAKSEVIKKIDRTAKRNRHVRDVLEFDRTQKRRLFTWRGCKPKPDGGLSSPGEELEITRHASHNTRTPVSSLARENMSASFPGATVETPLPGSLVYDLKHLRRTTIEDPDRERHRRLFKIPAIIQDRFKSLLKNLTSTTKSVNATKRGPKSNSKCTCNCTCRMSTEASKTTEADELEREDLKDDGFRITCGPSMCSERKMTSTTVMATTEPTHPQHTPEREWTPYVTPRPHHTTDPKCFKFKGHVLHDLPNDTLYVEPEIYNDQSYYETGPLQRPPQTTQYTDTVPDLCMKDHYDIKRDIQQQNTFTAKDVAALEVIVDLMKNTLSYEEKDIASVFNNNNFMQAHATKSAPHNESTNSIQVHIAIPFDFQGGKKRSPLDPVRVRKVFSAKMSTPVDLEYQVHSFEGTVGPTPSTCNNIVNNNSSGTTEEGLSPGMYLLVDKPRNGYALKPVKGKINISDLRTRQAVPATEIMTEPKPPDAREETTSLKSLAKVTLSKDFIAAVNKHLIDLYENMSRVNKEVTMSNKTRPARSVWKCHKLKESEEEMKNYAEKYISKRRIDWEAVKKYFGHDRVCNCKCKSNKAMCRACAASDAVIDELIFEFDNIGRYMTDHCTEIQTFFWMNPGGGQKLRESVSRIDKSLGDYYKRVKGKCQGRTCKTFTTYIDKRQLVKTSKAPRQDVISHLLNDLAGIAEDLNKTISLKACFNHKLKEEGEKFLHAINSCIMKKSFDKRSNPNTTKRKLIKNVYSLDNINVNIICNPESTTTTTTVEAFDPTSANSSHLDSTQRVSEHLFDYDIDETKLKKRKGFKKLFPRKNKKGKLFTYFVSEFTKKPKIQFKRNVNVVVTPLISDGGGSFWFDYIKASTHEPRVARDSLKEKSNIEIAVVQKGLDGAPKVQTISEKKSNPVNTIYMTVKTSPKKVVMRDTEATTDYLTHNINQLLQLFGSLQDIESMNMHSNRSTMFLTPPTTSERVTVTTKILKNKPTKGDGKDTTVTTQSVYDPTEEEEFSALNPPPEEKPPPPPPPPPPCKPCKPCPKPKPKPKPPPKKEKEKKPKEETTIIIKDYTTMAPTTATPSPSPETVPKLTPTPTSPVAETTKPMTASSEKVKTTTSLIPTLDAKKLIPDIDTRPIFDEAEGQTLKQTSTATSFLGKLKTATLRFFDNVGKSPKEETDSTTTTISSEGLSSRIIDRISNTEMNLEAFDESSQRTTQMSPTIVIINEYDNQLSSDVLNDPNKDSEGYRNLLLSIIQYETNKLHDEWHRIAYGKERDDGDIKRSIIDFEAKQETTKPPKCKPKEKDLEYDIFEQLPDPKCTTKKPEGIFDKLVNKIGIKIVSGQCCKKKEKEKDKDKDKEKAVKKPTLREFSRRKINRKRKSRPINWRPPDRLPGAKEKACDSRRTTKPSEICDIQATSDQILDLQKVLPAEDFEKMVKNISCFKYRNVEPNFYIPYKRKGRKWDWIRNKRSLKLHFSRVKDETDCDDEIDVVDFDDDVDDSFERYVRGDDGIYKIVKRKKRTASLQALDIGLRNIPPLMPAQNELYVMVGDAITMNCIPDSPTRSLEDYHWKTDRRRMLKQSNVEVNGETIYIHNVQPRNSGSYTCSQDKTIKKKVRLNVMTIPSFDIVFLPYYKTQENCSYDDLKAIQSLGNSMAEATGCGKACSVRIDEPVCQRDRATNDSIIRPTAVISMVPREVNCSLECRRDIMSNLVMLCAANTPVLSNIDVVISKDGVNETLTPWRDLVRPVVTHSLRKKDTNGHHEYHKLVSSLSPGKVDVVLICPAGFYLLPEHKICSSCPPNTRSSRGDNTCTACPRGTRAEPGAAKCRVVEKQPRRYDWWWYPPCGYFLAAIGVVLGCSLCVLLALVVNAMSRPPDDDDDEDDDDDDEDKDSPEDSGTAAYVHTAHTRPLSPSRVILARFFKPSLTSSRATDSQETKFELWKERNIPPPLPPIDFDF